VVVQLSKPSGVEIWVSDETTVRILDSDDGERKGPSTYWVANDTPSMVNVKIAFDEFNSCNDDSEAYSVFSLDSPPLRGAYLGVRHVHISLTYPGGKRYDVSMTLDLKNHTSRYSSSSTKRAR